jgi:hypothetical protein
MSPGLRLAQKPFGISIFSQKSVFWSVPALAGLTCSAIPPVKNNLLRGAWYVASLSTLLARYHSAPKALFYCGVKYSTEAGYVKYSPEEVVDAVVAAAAFPGGLSNLFACIVSAVVYF